MILKIPLRERQRLRWKLDYGDINKVAEKANCSRWTVSRFFSGYYSSHRILAAILEVIEEKEALEWALREALLED